MKQGYGRRLVLGILVFKSHYSFILFVTGVNGCICLFVRVDCALLSVALSLIHIFVILSGVGCGSKVEL